MHTAQLRRIFITSLLVGTAACAGVDENTWSSSGPLAAQPTLIALRSRFARRVELPPQRLDANLTTPVVEYRPVLTDNAVNAVLSNKNGFVGVDAAFATLPATGDGSIALLNGDMSARVSLDGAASVPGASVDGYVVYVGAAPGGGGGTTLLRPSREAVEDYVVYETAPPASEATYTVATSAVAGLRLVDNVLELLDDSGTPRLRASAPYLVDANGNSIKPDVSVSGCSVDTSPLPPWGRPVIAPGKAVCKLHISWAANTVAYPAILDPAWSTTTNMVQPRTQHTAAIATVSSQQRVFVFGGVTGAGTIAGAELYDPLTNTWTAAASPVFPRTANTTVRLSNGNILVAGGFSSAAAPFVAVTEIYDPSTGTWATSGTMALGRRDASAELLPNGNVLVAGGWIQSTSDYTSGAEVFNTAAGTWSTTGAMSTARGSFATAMLKTGKILAAGGGSSTSSSTNLATAETYDYASGTWSSAGTMTQRRYRSAIVRTPFNQKVIVAGGSTSGTSTATATSDVYDPVSNTWQAGPNMVTARVGAAFCATPGSHLLVSGGSNGMSPLSSVEVFDAPTNAWRTDVSTSETRQDVPATLVGVADVWRVLVAGLSVTGTTSGELRESDTSSGDAPAPDAINVDWGNPTLSGSLTSATAIAGSATNTSAASLSVQLFTRAFGLDQRTVRRSIGTYTIAAGATKNFTVSVGALPIQSVGMQSQVQLEAQYTPTGGTSTVVESPLLQYSFVSGYASATFTGWTSSDDLLATPAGTGTPFSRALESLRASANAVHTFSGRFWNGTAFTSYSASSSTKKGTYYFRGLRHREYDMDHPPASGAGSSMPAAGTVRLCTTWRAQFKDGGHGEAYGNSNAPLDFLASRARFAVTPTAANSPLAYTDYLGPDGCTGYMTLPVGNYLLFQDSYLRHGGATISVVYGGWDPRVVSIPANGIPNSADPNSPIAAEEFAPWNVSLATGFSVGVSNPDPIALTPSYTDMAVRGAAAMGQTFNTPDNGSLIAELAPIVNYRVIANKVCPVGEITPTNPAIEACGSFAEPTLNLGPTPDKKSHTTFSKITIGHEFGHVIQGVNFGGQSRSLTATSSNALCLCNHVTNANKTHCLQSRESIGGAQTEAFGHFFASRTWNDPASSTCVFAYYKQFLETGGATTPTPVIKSCKNPVGSNPKWMITNCDSTSEGTEYDWMLFYYAVNTAAAADKTDFATLARIHRRMCSNGILGANCTGQVTTWAGTNGMAPAAFAEYGSVLDPHYVKFLNTGTDTGVNR
ncbi:hypothetical protein BH09MYX1_BH09MYX1_02390 [soil metagenome]